MATSAQIRANRENAQRSTGPRSAAGIENCKNNALKHGLAARKFVVAPDEKAEELEALRAQLRQDHQPETQIEEILVEEIAQNWWRVQRARQHEATALKRSGGVDFEFYTPLLSRILRYMGAAERAMQRAITQLRTAQNDRRRHEASVPSPAPSPQPEQTEKVMAIGSVAQYAAGPSSPVPAREETSAAPGRIPAPVPEITPFPLC
jgi:hypothetical protein